MEFTCKREDLVRELDLARGVVSSSGTIPILGNVLLEASGESVRITATDLELGIRCAIPASVKKAGAATSPAKRLLNYVKALAGGDVLVKVSADHWASVVSGRSRARIAGMSVESFPELPDMPAPVVTVAAGVLAVAFARTSFAASREESKFTMMGELLVFDSGKMRVVATDGHRLAFVERAALEDISLRLLVGLRGVSEPAGPRYGG